MNLYEILEIKQNANTLEIKQSYYRLSKIHHPDKGGDCKKFNEISKAYNILKDPESRKNYDKTGRLEEPFNFKTAAKDKLCKLFVDNVITNERAAMDPLGCMSLNLEKEKAEIDSAMVKNERAIQMYKKLKSNLKCKNSNDYFGYIIDNSIKEAEAFNAKNEKKKKVIDEAKKLLKEYKFLKDKKEDTFMQTHVSPKFFYRYIDRPSR